MKTDVDDRIHIEQLEIFTRVGVSENERANPQRLVANITIWPSRDFRDLADEVERTADYVAVCEEAKTIGAEQPTRLIETLADRIASNMLQKFPVRMITVELRKFALKDAAYTSVTLTRCASLD
jgi:dihydroneopterin aldolase